MSVELRPSNDESSRNLKVNIKSLSQLKQWLSSKNIDYSRWGTGTTKSIENLWEELINEEMILQENPPFRVIPVTRVIIRKGDDILIESRQEFDDKRVRSRNHPPSEKIKRGETYIDAAIRCLQEELGIERRNFEIIESTYHQTQKELDSPSYPGLYTRYIFHIVEANVDELPDSDFWTNEASHNRNDPITRHHWVWQHQTDAGYY